MRTRTPENFKAVNAIITGVYPKENKIGIGTNLFSLAELFEDFEYQSDDTWVPFGMETGQVIKFEVGKIYSYYGTFGEEYRGGVSARFVDPFDNKLKVVFEGSVYEVYVKDGIERLNTGFTYFEPSADDITEDLK